jgi:predicted  nucleic acid-binding Zn-ribbon protein
MTPEERFERIEKILEEMNTERHISRNNSDERFARIERSQKFIVESQAQLTTEMSKLTTEMSNAMTMITRLADTVDKIFELYRRHTRDNHGPETK